MRLVQGANRSRGVPAGATDHSDLVKVIARHAAALTPKDSREWIVLTDRLVT